MKTMTILRGVSGAGKSRWLQGKDVRVASADHFFQRDGVYQFAQNLLQEAHCACFRDAVRHCAFCYLQAPNVVIDNTNLSVAEIAPYYLLGQSYDCEVEILTLVCDLEVAYLRNLHGVPRDRLSMMEATRIQQEFLFPPWWKHTVVKEGA